MTAISPWAMSYVKDVAIDYFHSTLEQVRFRLLSGGYGAASNVRLAVAGRAYVLRVISDLESPLKRDTEVYALKAASAAGIAPQVHWTSPDGYTILMDYIPGGTLTIEQAKRPEIMATIANLMHKAHALPKNPINAPSFESQMEEAAQLYSQGDSNQAIWTEAIAIIKEGAVQLQNLHAPIVSTHGDLNPRNILVSHPDVYFIDWGDGTYADPFQDLAFFSIMMDYDAGEEATFLQGYLGHPCTPIEKQRFLIAKKMNFARLVLSGRAIGNQLHAEQKKDDSPLEPLREWSYYAKVFANENTHLSAQFFWGQAEVALQLARALDVENKK